MFDPSHTPRVFALPPGVDFAQNLTQGVLARLEDSPPEAIARVEIWVNTRRMQRRLREVFSQRAGLLPQIKVLSDGLPALGGSDTASPSGLAQKLSLLPLISQLMETQTALSAEGAAYELCTSLSALFEELNGEGVPFSQLESLDVSDESGHWQRALAILRAVASHLPKTARDSGEARLRALAEAALATWEETPPTHPILVAGSTGSRGTTALVMRAVAHLPQGAVILPGFDWHLTEEMHRALSSDTATEDHPQYRFVRFLQDLGLKSGAIDRWTPKPAPNEARNRLVSVALCPAPATHFWADAQAQLPSLSEAVDGLTLLEAPTPRDEANAIAVRLREAVELGQTAALISPDRVLTRRVSAALSRWDLIGDDSAGVPLALSPPGRLLLMLRDFPDRPSGEDIIQLLKLPLVHSNADRGLHLLRVQTLELALRKGGPAYLGIDDITAWAAKLDDGTQAWAAWLCEILNRPSLAPSATISDHLEALRTHAEALCAGTGETGSGALWDEAAGRELRAVLGELETHSEQLDPIPLRDFYSVLTGVIGDATVRNQSTPHPLVKIWGTLEARVQSADVVILAGLNEGVWPEMPTPDPWLNRAMRAKLGLLLPDREIGLAAHDFQLGMGAKDVWITRAARSDEAETVPSRWVNRLTHLLEGLPDGDAALAKIRGRAAPYLAWAKEIEAPKQYVPQAVRPSPVPPVNARPRQLSVTQIKTLIRDPYAIYARHILKLQPLDPLRSEPDARLRGTVIHDILEQFMRLGAIEDLDSGVARLMRVAELVLQSEIPWPAARRITLGRVARFAPSFLRDEMVRQASGYAALMESRGELSLPGVDFTLTAKPDRIDLAQDGTAVVYDYKTGVAPSAKQQLSFDKQLLLTAVMAEKGAFAKLGRVAVQDAKFISLSPNGTETSSAPLSEEAEVWARLQTLIQRYYDADQGFTARRAMEEEADVSDYDGLSRFGEWDLTDRPAKVYLG